MVTVERDETMTWDRRGLVYGPDGSREWSAHSALQPTPLVRGDEIRVYCGLRDEGGRSSIGWVDLSSGDPTVVLRECERPALSPGEPGSFDESGVVPTAVVPLEDRIRLYYAAYQPTDVPGERFRVFCGVADSFDGGDTFERALDDAVMGPNDDAPLFRVIHSVVRDGDVWRTWYGAGKEFWPGETKLLPVYDIRYCESPDGLRFPETGEVAIGLGEGEHRVGRPYVVRRPEGGPDSGSERGWEMFFGGGTEATTYRLAYARSDDARTWVRDDAALGMEVSETGFDSEMMAYPAVVRVRGGTYLFYNGNQYGRAGFAVAVLGDDPGAGG